MGESIWEYLEYLIISSVFVLAAIQRHKIFKILRQNKKIAKPKDDGGVKNLSKHEKTNCLNRGLPPKNYAPVQVNFKIYRT